MCLTHSDIVIRVGERMHKKNHDLRSNKKTSKYILNLQQQQENASTNNKMLQLETKYQKKAFMLVGR